MEFLHVVVFVPKILKRNLLFVLSADAVFIWNVGKRRRGTNHTMLGILFNVRTAVMSVMKFSTTTLPSNF